MVRTRRYLTGGLGSRHLDEAFGDPYELPPDRAYTETCAAIASVMVAWRLLLATGEPGYADAIERAIYNGVLSGLSLSGTEFLYVNPLQRRTHRTFEPAGHGQRMPWQACACCPPNLMRLLSSWQQYLATGDDSGIQLHQYASADIRTRIGGQDAEIAVRTAYPWDGRIAVQIGRTPERPWTLSLPVPVWCGSATLSIAGAAPVPVPAGVVERQRAWHPGDEVVLNLDTPVRRTDPDPLSTPYSADAVIRLHAHRDHVTDRGLVATVAVPGPDDHGRRGTLRRRRRAGSRRGRRSRPRTPLRLRARPRRPGPRARW
jgi:DUF1680 family protein